MPSRQQRFAIFFQVPDNITEFMSRESRVSGHRKVMEPEFGFFVA